MKIEWSKLERVMSYGADKLGVNAHGRTDRQTQATTIPEGQDWPRIKTKKIGLKTRRPNPSDDETRITLHHKVNIIAADVLV